MQCFCEPTAAVVPTACGIDGEDCLCNGLVYYMKKYDGANQFNDYYEGM